MFQRAIRSQCPSCDVPGERKYQSFVFARSPSFQAASVTGLSVFQVLQYAPLPARDLAMCCEVCQQQ